jgi:hypothetical protein
MVRLNPLYPVLRLITAFATLTTNENTPLKQGRLSGFRTTRQKVVAEVVMEWDDVFVSARSYSHVRPCVSPASHLFSGQGESKLKCTQSRRQQVTQLFDRHLAAASSQLASKSPTFALGSHVVLTSSTSSTFPTFLYLTVFVGRPRFAYQVLVRILSLPKTQKSNLKLASRNPAHASDSFETCAKQA